MADKVIYDLPCGNCGEPVRLSRSRYLQLVESQRLPLCRANGCFRLARGGDGAETGRAGMWLAAEGKKQTKAGRSIVKWRLRLNR